LTPARRAPTISGVADDRVRTTCCVAGGGPAGMLLGVLLARAGIDVVVLERHADFLRDFRGDTIHPSTLELLAELGWLDDLLALPHRKARRLRVRSGGHEVVAADFGHLPTRAKYVAFLPQWDFLDFLAAKGAAYPGFHLRMEADVVGLLGASPVGGVRAETPGGRLEVAADLVVGADGRGSSVRRLAGLRVTELGAPMDVLWFSLPRVAGDPEEPIGRFEPGQLLIMIDRGSIWQCGRVIAKGSLERVRAAGLDAFRAELAVLAPFVADRVGALASWDDVKLLTVKVDRLATWYRPGLLCIGDAAHAMSPVGGVGINLAVQDAVAAANLLAGPLLAGTVGAADLARVQRRRELPARLVQAAQVQIQRRALRPLLAGGLGTGLPLALRLVARFPVLARVPGRLIGLGVRPEHVRSPG
jgi:2-polyprenyl-6-methoxyphenol hydroxylase-like FAD-dependent oxidoreductase